jgi:hypothetical protein
MENNEVKADNTALFGNKGHATDINNSADAVAYYFYYLLLLSIDE